MPHPTPWQGNALILDRRTLTPGFVALTLDAPAIARQVVPGQFVNLLIDGPDACLRRPISVHAADGATVTLVVGVLGAGTAWLAQQEPGETLDVLGPLGRRGLTLAPDAETVALVGGGVGIPPLHFLATRRPADGPKLIAYVGARTQDRLLGVQALRDLGCEVVVATDDGSAGYPGTVTAALALDLQHRAVDQVLTCGPTPMMRAAATVARDRGLPCQVCLEARMACALGACLSCVIETTTPGWRKYQRVCTEGPVFDAAEVVWDSLSPLVAL